MADYFHKAPTKRDMIIDWIVNIILGVIIFIFAASPIALLALLLSLDRVCGL